MSSPARHRNRLTGVLFGGAALGTTGYIAALTVSALAVEDITGSATVAGLPSATAIIGTAVGTSLLTVGVSRRGRRPGLVTGYILGTAGAALAVLAVVLGSLVLLIAGMGVLGLGHASNQLARYTGADLHPPDRRASALSLIVWAGTIGSVAGPALLQPAGRLAESFGRSELAGGYLVAAVAMAAALLLYLVALRPDPMTVAVEDPPDPAFQADTEGGLGSLFRLPQVRVALAALIAGQVVMVMIMTSTPLHIRHHGWDLGIVGLVMSAHTLGMFAFSPVTGKLADRFGRFPVVVAGLAQLGVSAVVAAWAPTSSTGLLVVALFLLGLGWNFTFVAGSALLTVGVAEGLRARLQGRVDSLTWTSSAVSSAVSGAFFELTDYRMVALAGLALLVTPVVVVARNRQRLATALA